MTNTVSIHKEPYGLFFNFFLFIIKWKIITKIVSSIQKIKIKNKNINQYNWIEFNQIKSNSKCSINKSKCIWIFLCTYSFIIYSSRIICYCIQEKTWTRSNCCEDGLITVWFHWIHSFFHFYQFYSIFFSFKFSSIFFFLQNFSFKNIFFEHILKMLYKTQKIKIKNFYPNKLIKKKAYKSSKVKSLFFWAGT